jgi:carbonic anhydrase/acetyltransferase-like protein (isoleucine patch superfamily)
MALYGLGDLEPRIDPEAFVHPDAVLIGDVTLGPQASVWPSAVLRADTAPITVGARTSIQDGTVVHVSPGLPTAIGDDCVVGHLAHMEGCTIEDGALIGSGAVVLHRAIVRTEALVGASALVPGGMEVPRRATALGVPAKVRPDTVDPAVMIEVAKASYVDRAARYREELRRLD